MQVNKFSITILVYVLFSIGSSAQDFQINLKNETGWFSPLSKGNYSKPAFINDLDVSAEYEFEKNLSLVGNLQPQWYGIEDPFFSLGYSLKTEASYRFRNYDFNSSLLFLKKNYTSKRSEIDISQYVINANWLWYNQLNQSIYFDVNYGFRIFANINEYRLQLINATTMWIFNRSPYIRSGIGVFFEQFWIDNTLNGVPQSENNRGTRVGPVLHYKYLKNYILSLDYNFVLHISQQTNFPSYEHWIKLLAGKNLTSNLTLLLFIDYQARYYGVLPYTDQNLLYSSLQTENRIYIKLDYDINDAITGSLKTGYRKDDFIKALQPISGIQTTLGFEFKL